MDDKTQNFCHYYDAQIGRSHKSFRRPMWSIVSTASPSDSIAPMHFPVQDIPMVEIHMPEDRFKHLVEMRDSWEKTMQRSFHTNDPSKIIWEQYEKESRLRHQHPALQELWQQYQAMLELVDIKR